MLLKQASAAPETSTVMRQALHDLQECCVTRLYSIASDVSASRPAKLWCGKDITMSETLDLLRLLKERAFTLPAALVGDGRSLSRLSPLDQPVDDVALA